MKVSTAAYTTRQNSSVLILILMNLIPAYGVLFEDWQAFDVVYIYVMETIIIGILNLFKMAFSTTFLPGKSLSSLSVHILKIFLIPFFILHYFFFIAIQSIFVFSFLKQQKVGDLQEIPLLFLQIFNENSEIGLSVMSILGSHIFSFLINYIGNKEYAKIGLPMLMIQPYIRIFIQQLVVIIGIILMSIFNTPDIFVLLLVFFKIIADVIMHLRVHQKYQTEIEEKK